MSAGEPASRTRRAPAAVSARAWFWSSAGSCDRPVGAEADVAVGVDEARHDPAAGGDGLGAGRRLEGEAPVDDPEVALLLLGQEDAPDV